jgi:hypothetical protein
MNFSYIPSRLSPEAEFLRERSFTRWMSRDLLQPASDFLRHLQLIALYAECTGAGHRYLLWHPPEKWGCELRSGRTLDQFEGFDRANVARGWPLLSLHIDETGIHSAVWISPEIFGVAVKMLAFYGITPAERVSRP